jgi:hypothetical protein
MRVIARSSPSRILVLLVAAAALVPAALTPLTHDVAGTLTVSRRLLDGAHLYRDVIEYAPPLIFLLGLPIEAIARVTGWPEWPLVIIAVIALAAASLTLVRRLLPFDGLGVTTMVGAVVMLLASAARDFGQPDHLALILLLPCIVWCARQATGDDLEVSRGARIGVGVMTCACLALKPIFAIVYLALLAYVAGSRRTGDVLRALEQRIVAIGLATYVIAILLFMPDYFWRVLPMAYVQHWIYGDPLGPMVSDWMVLSVVVSSLVLVVCGPWLTRGGEWGTLVRACALTSLAMFLAFILQRDASPVYFLPVRALNFLAAWLAAVGFGRSLLTPSKQPVTLALRTVAIALAIMPPGVVWSLIYEVQSVDYANAQAGLRSPFVEPLIDLVHQRAAGKPIFVLSSSIGPAFPLVNLTEATWPYRFKSLEFVSIYYKDVDNPRTAAYRPPSAQSAAERAFFDDVVGDLTRRPPALLIVDVTRLKQGFGLTYFDFLTYYRQSPAFGALLRHYRLIEWKKNFQVFEYQPSI